MGMNVLDEQADTLTLPRLDSRAMKIICTLIAMYIASLLAAEVGGQQPSPEQKAAMAKLKADLMAMPWERVANSTRSSDYAKRKTATDILMNARLSISLMRGLRAHENSDDLEQKRRIHDIIAHHSASTADLIPVDELYDMLCDKGPMPWYEMYKGNEISFNGFGQAPSHASRMSDEENRPFPNSRNVTYNGMQTAYRQYVLSGGEKGMSKCTIRQSLNDMSWNEFLWTVKNPRYQSKWMDLRQPKHWMSKFERLGK